MIRSEALPVRVLLDEGLMVPEVWPLRVLRTDAASEVSVRVMSSSPRLLMPEES